MGIVTTKVPLSSGRMVLRARAVARRMPANIHAATNNTARHTLNPTCPSQYVLYDSNLLHVNYILIQYEHFTFH